MAEVSNVIQLASGRRTKSAPVKAWTEARAEHVPPAAVNEVRALNAELQAWSLLGFEVVSREKVEAEVLPRASELLARSRTFFESIDGDNEVPTRGDVAPAEDIAFFALQEISAMQGEISRFDPETQAWQIVEVLERQRGSLMAACSALHQSLCHRAGCEYVDDVRATEVAKAVRVRSKLAWFRAELIRGTWLAGDEIIRRVRLAGTVITKLMNSDEFEDFRFGDRMLIRENHRAILAWLRCPHKERQKAQRIWDDLLGFAEISRGINRQADLEEHDGEVLYRLAQELDEVPDGESIPDELRSMVRSLWGLHPHLDELIESQKPRPLLEWRHCVQRLSVAVVERLRTRPADPKRPSVEIPVMA